MGMGVVIVVRFLFISLVFLLCMSPASFGSDDVLPWPDSKTFQSGDLLWPNKPGAFVPYSFGTETSANAAQQSWSRDRDRFIERARASGTYLSATELDRLNALSFREFYSRYAGDRHTDQQIDLYSNDAAAFVGHVAIIDIGPDGRPWIIEASLKNGVTRTSYEDWLKPLKGYYIWHGRIKDADQSARGGVAQEAAKYVGRPYDFWNFDLGDDRGFYCSKLVWLSAFRSLKVAVDGDQNAKRHFWFSPKQLLNSAHIMKLHNPGNYSHP
jgi:uncharacterized protein YycO